MRYFAFLIMAISTLLTTETIAMPGAAIPRPLVKLEKALKLAREEHVKLGNKRYKDMIIVSTEYVHIDEIIKRYGSDPRRFGAIRKKGTHQWMIKFVNPVENDVTVTYMVTQDGKCQLFGMTT